MDLGASRRGVDMGPSAIRIANVGDRLRNIGHQVTDRGNLLVNVREALEAKDGKAKYLDEIAEVISDLSAKTYQVLKDGEFPVVLGGDHSIAIGTVAGLTRYYREKSQKVGIIWVDAHADMNTPATTVSGNIHGMPVAHILGVGAKELLSVSDTLPMVDPRNVCLIGIRDVDRAEAENVKKLGVHAYTMRDIDERGIRSVMMEAIDHASSGTVGFHTSFDVDGVDPSFAPGVGTAVPGGITYREAHLIMELIHDSKKMLGLELAEVNPMIDVGNQTANLAVEMILSAFGKTIL
jgi:arginase